MRIFTKTIIVIGIFTCGLALSSEAKDARVKGYTKKDGTYVVPHHRSTPDKTKSNNYGTKGNTNPYTGKKGTANPDKK